MEKQSKHRHRTSKNKSKQKQKDNANTIIIDNQKQTTTTMRDKGNKKQQNCTVFSFLLYYTYFRQNVFTMDDNITHSNQFSKMFSHVNSQNLFTKGLTS